jgi:hypothetical protein
MNCEKCDNGYLLVADYQHDVMMRVKCADCLAHENMKMLLSKDLSKVFVQLSTTYLAKLLADVMISVMDSETNPDFDRLSTLIATKNKDSLVAWLQVMI